MKRTGGWPWWYGGGVLVALFTLFPLYLMVKISVSPPQDIFTPHPAFGLRAVTADHWKAVLASETLWPPLGKSLAVATWTMLAAIGLAAPAAYVISRLSWPWKYGLLLGLFASRMVPEVGVALPIAVRFLQWGLLDTQLGLVLAHLIKTLPFVAWILVGSFETIPVAVEEAAQVDGCDRLRVLTRVVFPMALPGVAVAALLAWLESWNEFTYALYLSLIDNTLPLQIYYYVTRGSWFDSATYTTILTVPVIVVTACLQRYLKAGYLAGAVKG
jgi:trehalose transport system permease protein